MISALDLENLKLKIFKISVRNHCHKDCVVPLANFKLTICDMIKKKEKSRVVIRNGNSNLLAGFKNCDHSNTYLPILN
jgi:hypothetical protein